MFLNNMTACEFIKLKKNTDEKFTEHLETGLVFISGCSLPFFFLVFFYLIFVKKDFNCLKKRYMADLVSMDRLARIHIW